MPASITPEQIVVVKLPYSSPRFPHIQGQPSSGRFCIGASRLISWNSRGGSLNPSALNDTKLGAAISNIIKDAPDTIQRAAHDTQILAYLIGNGEEEVIDRNLEYLREQGVNIGILGQKCHIEDRPTSYQVVRSEEPGKTPWHILTADGKLLVETSTKELAQLIVTRVLDKMELKTQED